MDGILPAGLLRLAAALAESGSYDRKATGSVFNPLTRSFSLTGLIERAAHNAKATPATLQQAKALLCRTLRTPHLDVWEQHKPTSDQVHAALMEAIDG